MGAPEQPVHHHTGQRAQPRPDFDDPKGVPIDAIIFGGRTSDREPLIRAITDLAEGVYDGLTLGAEATFAAEGVDGQLRYDPMSMRPFMSYPEGAYAAHWLKIIGSAPRSRSSRTSTGSSATPTTATSCGPDTGTTCARCCGCCGSRTATSRGGRRRSASSPPQTSSTWTAWRSRPTISNVLSIDAALAAGDDFREEHLAQFPGLPEEIWDAHRRVAAALDDAD